MQYASNLIPVTLELGGKSPNIFFDDVAAIQDAFYDKALEGFAMFALNQGEVCTCPSRALIQGHLRRLPGSRRSSASSRSSRATRSTPNHVGAQASNDQFERSCPTSTSESRRAPRCSPAAPGPTWRRARRRLLHPADHLRGRQHDADLPGGDLRPGGLRDRFNDYDDALKIANDTLYGLGAGSGAATNTAYRMGRTSRRAASGRTAITPTRRTRRSAATSSRASAARTTR